MSNRRMKRHMIKTLGVETFSKRVKRQINESSKRLLNNQKGEGSSSDK
jgi:hypothetical protein